jgi:hypothetical protein
MLRTKKRGLGVSPRIESVERGFCVEWTRDPHDERLLRA